MELAPNHPFMMQWVTVAKRLQMHISHTESHSWVLSTLPNCKYPPHVKLTLFILHLYYAILDRMYVKYYLIPYNEEHD